MQEGSGTPSHENIRPIKGRDSVKVERCGENLFDIAKVTETNILTKTDRQITLKAGRGYNYDLFVSSEGLTTDVPTNLLDRLPFFPKGTYKISYNTTDPDVLLSIVAVAKDGSVTVITTNIQSAFTLSYGTLISIRCSIVEEVTLSNIQITIGATAPTTYTPYTGQTNTLTLPETVYGGEVDAVTGEGQDTWKMLTLYGTEPWVENRDWGIGGRNSYRLKNADIGAKIELNSPAICSHFPTAKYISATNTVNLSGSCICKGESSFVVILDDANLETVDKWKTYLAEQYSAGSPIQVAFLKKTITSFTVTGAQPMPALAGVNTVLTDADSATVTGRADPIKRITDLEDAVASQT